MSSIVLHFSANSTSNVHFTVSGSKSISQRALIINHLIEFKGTVVNLSNSRDTQILEKCLSSNNSVFNVYNSGTSLRFLTSYLAMQDKEFTIYGDSYLLKRPIKLLLDYLSILGARVNQEKNKIIIKKGKIKGGVLELSEMNTSQFISSLLLI